MAYTSPLSISAPHKAHITKLLESQAMPSQKRCVRVPLSNLPPHLLMCEGVELPKEQRRGLWASARFS